MTFTYTYNDAGGNYLGSITRNINDAGKKTFRASTGFPDPRPLYGLELGLPSAPTLLSLLLRVRRSPTPPARSSPTMFV